MFTKSPLDDALHHLNRKERLEALELKVQIKLFEQDEKENHPTIIKIEDRVSKNINMGNCIVVLPTEPVAPPMYPVINKHPTQY